MQTIIAPASSPYQSAIGILRMSGDQSKDVIKKIFSSKKEWQPNVMYYGYIMEENKKLDEVMAVYFRAPHSYTGEDVVEIYTHGGKIAISRVIDRILEEDVVLAEPGEFTKRAFMNGKVDLSQAEAIMDLIGAKTSTAFDIGLEQLSGTVSESIKDLREELLGVIAQIEVGIDYPEEDIEEITFQTVVEEITKIKDELENILRQSAKATQLKVGINTVLVGKTNVGKSSLLNLFLGKERAIVTDIEGTTRDTIEEEIVIGDVLLNLIDTAGLRKTDEVVEKIGIERSEKAIERAELILYVLDASRELSQEEIDHLASLQNRNLIILINKSDQESKIEIEKLHAFVEDEYIIRTSAAYNRGREDVLKAIEKMMDLRDFDIHAPLLTNARQIQNLEKAIEHLAVAKEAATQRVPYDFLEVDLQEALTDLGNILGLSLRTDIPTEIFSRFCLGK